MHASEHQRGGLLGFLRTCRSAAWLEYRNLRYYPSNLVLAATQELTAVGVWYFVGRFLNGGASQAVQQYGGNYLAYVVLGVLLNQVCLAALNGPFTTMSEAFWDKRLETYRLAVHGIWANLPVRLAWQVLFSTCLQVLALLLLLFLGGVSLHTGINWPLVLCAFLLLVLSNAGLGVAGASLFFLLEVKSGQDPITWAYRYLVMLASGLYVPPGVLPGWLWDLGSFLPQTYGFAVVRAIVLTGVRWDAPVVWGISSHSLLPPCSRSVPDTLCCQLRCAALNRVAGSESWCRGAPAGIVSSVGNMQRERTGDTWDTTMPCGQGVNGSGLLLLPGVAST